MALRGLLKELKMSTDGSDVESKSRMPEHVISRRHVLSGAAGAFGLAVGFFGTQNDSCSQSLHHPDFKPMSDDAVIVPWGAGNESPLSNDDNGAFVEKKLYLRGKWSATEFIHGIAWGNGNAGRDVWESLMPSGQSRFTYRLRLISARPQIARGCYYIIVGLEKAMSQSTSVTAMFRYRQQRGYGEVYGVSAVAFQF
jgi:hypothetical protein